MYPDTDTDTASASASASVLQKGSSLSQPKWATIAPTFPSIPEPKKRDRIKSWNIVSSLREHHPGFAPSQQQSSSFASLQALVRGVRTSLVPPHRPQEHSEEQGRALEQTHTQTHPPHQSHPVKKPFDHRLTSVPAEPLQPQSQTRLSATSATASIQGIPVAPVAATPGAAGIHHRDQQLPHRSLRDDTPGQLQAHVPDQVELARRQPRLTHADSQVAIGAPQAAPNPHSYYNHYHYLHDHDQQLEGQQERLISPSPRAHWADQQLSMEADTVPSSSPLAHAHARARARARAPTSASVSSVNPRSNPSLTSQVPSPSPNYHHGNLSIEENWDQPAPVESQGAPTSQTRPAEPAQRAPTQTLAQAPTVLHQASESHSELPSQRSDSHQLAPPLDTSGRASPPHSRQPHQPQAHSHPHPQAPKQPPQLPPLTAPFSPIEPLGSFLKARDATHRPSSSWTPSPPPPPAQVLAHAAAQPVPRLPPLVDDIVSPISETRSSTPAALRNLNLDDVPISSSAHRLANNVASPTSRRQSTWTSFTGTSLFDDRDFDLGFQSSDKTDRANTSALPSAAVSSAVAHDVARLTADNSSDDWFRFGKRDSAISKYTNYSSFDPHQNMTVAMAAERANMPEQQHHTNAPSTSTSSFTPLPPIRRTSTFDLLRKKGLGDDDSDSAPSPIEKDVPPVPPMPAGIIQQNGHGQLPAASGQGQSYSSPHNSVQPPSSSSQQNLTQGNHSSQSHPPMQQPPNGVPASGYGGQHGVSQYTAASQMHPQQQAMMMGPGNPNGQQPAQSQMYQSGQASGQPSPPPVNGQSQGFMSQMRVNGNPVQHLPPMGPMGRQWKLEESHLSEPLNPSNRIRNGNSPPMQQPSHFAYDKETEVAPAPPQSASTSQPQFQSRMRQGSVPPSSAQRFPTLFASPGQDQNQAHMQQQNQSQHPLLRGQNSTAVNGARDNRSSKDMGGESSLDKAWESSDRATAVHVDQVSVSSVATEDTGEKQRRGSAAREFLGFGHRRNTSTDQASQQQSQMGPPEKKRTFFGSVAGLNSSQPKQKSNLGLAKSSTFDRNDASSTRSTETSVPVKKRLSELKGMIRGVGSAKEGAYDDQPVKPTSAYESRPSMQGPGRGPVGASGPQGAQRPFGPAGIHQQQQQQQQQLNGVPGSMLPPGPRGPQPPNMQPGSMVPPPAVGMVRANTGGPQPSPVQHVQPEEHNKKVLGGGLSGVIGGLFNKQANKPKESKPQPNQQLPLTGQRSMQFSPIQPGQPFQPGQMQMPGQPLGPHPMYAGSPITSQGPAGQQGEQRLAGPTSPLSPGVRESSLLQTAEAVMLRRPSEITVSSQSPPGNTQHLSPTGRPSISQQTSSPARPSTSSGPNGIGYPQQQNAETSTNSPASPHLAKKGSREQLNVGAPGVPRFSPNRKPVGSGAPRQDGPFMTSAVAPSISQPDHLASPTPRYDQRRLSGQQSIQQSPPLGPSPSPGHARQPSLPSPSHSPGPSQRGQPSPQISRPSAERPEPNQGLGVFNGTPGQPGQPSISSGGGVPPNTLVFGPTGFRPAVQIQPPRPTGSPAPSMDQSKLSKFFGAYDGGKSVAQSQSAKEKTTNAASKFLGAFKRTSKQPEQAQPQQGPRHQPSQQMLQQQTMRPGMPGVPGQPGQANQPPRPGQPTPQQPGVPRPQMGGPVPPGAPGGMPTSPQGQIMPGQGRGQMHPQMTPQQMQMQMGRGAMSAPVIQGGRGQVPPQMMAGRGQMPQMPLQHMQGQPQPQIQYQQRTAALPNSSEPQYDQVPIPRGYEAVHGYGQGAMLAPSPYNIGRPSPPPAQHSYQSMVQQQGFQPQQSQAQQWDPRVMGPQTGSPYAQTSASSQPTSQGTPTQASHTPPQQHPVHTQPLQSPSGQQSNPPYMSRSPPPQQSLQQQPQAPAMQWPPQTSEERPSPQTVQGHPGQQPSPQPLTAIQRDPSPNSQAPAGSNSETAPENTQIPYSSGDHEQPLARTATMPSAVVDAPVSQSTDDEPQRQQVQHIASAIGNQGPNTGGLQPDHLDRVHSPNEGERRPAQPGLSPTQEQDSPTPSSSQTISDVPALNDQSKPADISRLVSRMSIAKEQPRSNSLSPEMAIERAMSVSPEPQGPRPVPAHQVSDQNLNVNVEQANRHGGNAEDDIYDATPRLGGLIAHGEDRSHENTKYAGSDKGHAFPNGATVSLAAAGGAVAGAAGSRASIVRDDNMSFLEGPEDSDTEGVVTPQRTVQMNMEPEEKILVDEPAELAAVNDDDDGMPTMSATSYPGQEWNPYGAGEFGDWDL
ncbi:hypothetical protein F5Y15DRAFT_228298 [Xylariaceae sp. FL0016]|nr:hypothetical protein F5Y15DRAFT_228298 [Xylariaceae sp. FL0016]